MKIMRCHLIFLVFFLGTVLPATVCPEDDSDAALQTTDLGVIIIESDSLKWRFKEKTVVFSKNVTAQREGLTIKCDKMRIYYIESENGDVDPNKILATDHVEITRIDGSSGTAEEAVYDFTEEIITMTGQATFKQGKNTLKGSSLIYDVREESIEGTDVKAILYREEKEGVSTGGQ